MSVLEIILMILLLVMCVFLVVSMLIQKGSNKLSSTIAGGQDTYFAKDKSARKDKVLALLTNIIGIALVVVVLLLYIIQPVYGTTASPSGWQSLSEYFSAFGKL